MDASRRRKVQRKRQEAFVKRQQREDVSPLASDKFRRERWIPYIFATEKAVDEVSALTGFRLTNDHVREALISLIRQIRGGQPAALPEEEQQAVYSAGSEVEFLAWNLRRAWRDLFRQEPTPTTEEMIGLLRTLLDSIETWNARRQGGYLVYLRGFLRDERQKIGRILIIS